MGVITAPMFSFNQCKKRLATATTALSENDVGRMDVSLSTYCFGHIKNKVPPPPNEKSSSVNMSDRKHYVK